MPPWPRALPVLTLNGYPERMPAASSIFLSALRAITMALLLLGVVFNPVVAGARDIHVLESTGSHADTGHQHQVETEADGDDHEDDPDGSSWHGLMHADCAHGATSEAWFAALPRFLPLGHDVVLPPTAPLTSLQHIAGPFRPPIV